MTLRVHCYTVSKADLGPFTLVVNVNLSVYPQGACNIKTENHRNFNFYYTGHRGEVEKGFSSHQHL